MKKTLTLITTTTAAFSLSNCAPQNYTQRDAAIGAGAGAIGGAIIGNQIGDGEGTAGALIGAGLGGTTGAVIGSNKDQQRRGYSRAPQPQYNRGY
jgi:phage tail tape-measure protein